MLNEHLKTCIFVGVAAVLILIYFHITRVDIADDDGTFWQNNDGKLWTTLKAREQETYLMGEGRNEFMQTHSENIIQSIQPSFSSSYLQDTSTENDDDNKINYEIFTPGEVLNEVMNGKTKFNFDSGLDIRSTREVFSENLEYVQMNTKSDDEQNTYDVHQSTEQKSPINQTLETKSTLVSGYGAAETHSLNLTCYADVLQNMKPICHPKCSIGSETFSLPGMMDCHRWLDCAEIPSEIKIIKEIGGGLVKQVFVGTWKNYSVVVNKLRSDTYRDDFNHGIEMLRALTGHKHVVQLVGICKEDDTFITEYHPLGNVLSFLRRLKDHPQLQPFDSLSNRMRFCSDYVRVITYLHDSPVGTRVMCDASQLGKLLEQMLVTNGLWLVLNDVDALPEVGRGDDEKIVCGHAELIGDFVAPEQKWPFQNRRFSEIYQPPYDEKIDVWKVPDVCEYFLGTDSSADVVKYQLFEIHKKCKSPDPRNRPSARDILKVYELLYETISQEMPMV